MRDSAERGGAPGPVPTGARCPCQALSHLSAHSKLHTGSEASVSTQEDTEAQGKQRTRQSHTAKEADPGINWTCVGLQRSFPFTI